MGQHKISAFNSTSANAIASSLAAPPRRPLNVEIVPLEPRLLMDASLGWDIGGTDQLVTMLSGIHTLVAAQIENYENFLETFHNLSDGALTALEVLADANERAGETNTDDIQAMVERMTEVVTELQSGTLSMLSAVFLDSDPSDTTSPESDLAALINGKLAVVDSVAGSAAVTYVSQGNVKSYFNLSAMTSNTLAEKADALVTQLMADAGLDLAGKGITAAELKTAIDGATDEFVTSFFGGTMALNLANVTAGGVDLVTFTQGATANEVEVSVKLPKFSVDFDALFATALGDAANPFSLDLDSAEEAITFKISTEVEKTGNVPNKLTLNIDQFDFAPLAQFGGAVTVSPDTKMTLGMLTVGVDTLKFAEMRIEVDAPENMNLGVALTLGGPDPVVWLGAGVLTQLGVAAKIKEVGGTDFETIAKDAEYALAELTLAGSLNFFQDKAAETSEAQTFTGSITLASVLDSSAATGAARVGQFLKDAKLGFDIDLSGTIAHEELRQTMENSIETLAAMGIDQITQFLGDVGDLLSTVLRSAVFDVNIPFTELELGTLFDGIAEVFGNLENLFKIQPKALGYDAGEPLRDEVALAVDSLDGGAFTADMLEGVVSLEFVIITGAQPTDRVTVSVDLSQDAVLTDANATDAEKADALAALLDAAFSTYAYAVTAIDGALRFAHTPGAPVKPIFLTAARKEDAANPGSTIADTTFSWATLGFEESALLAVPDAIVKGETDSALKILPERSAVFAPGAGFAEAMVGVESLTFVVVVDGVGHDIRISKPDAGWYDSASNAANLDDIQAALQEALDEAGLPLTAEVDGSGIKIAATDQAEGKIEFGVDPEKLVRAFDLDTLIEWVNVRLAGLEVLEGSQLKLTADGALIFVFPEVEKTLSVATTDGNKAGFKTSELAVGPLQGLELSAKLSAALSAKFTAGVGIDLLGFATSLLGHAIAEPAAGAEDEGSGVLVAKQSFTGKLGDAVMKNVFVTDMAFAGSVVGTATDITGSADFGLMKINVGARAADAAFAGANYMMLDAQLDLTLVGQNAQDGYNERVSLRNIADALLYKNAEGKSDILRGLNGLIGRTDLKGGIVTDGEGQALDAAGEVVTQQADVRRVDADDYELKDGEKLSQMLLHLGDVTVDVAGIEGLNEGIIEGVSLTIDNLARPLDSLGYVLLGDGADAINALGTLGEGDILDSFSTILDLVKLSGEALKEKLPFLDQKIPLLNFSVLDAVDFSKDLSARLKEIRANPNAALAQLDATLEGVFGKDTVTLKWNATDKVLGFALRFEFLKDYKETLPFQFDLESLIGDQLAELVGPEVAKVMLGLADVSGDGQLIFDPDLTMNFAFGLDLSKTLLDTAPLVSGATKLDSIATVGSINQSKVATNDLRIVWEDKTDKKTAEILVDLDDMTTLQELVDTINAQAQTGFGESVSFTFDAATGVITLSDSNAAITLTEGVTALFGAETKGSAPANEPDPKEPEAFIPQVLALKADFADFAKAHSFHIAFGASADELGDGVDVELEADADRDTAEEFAEALNAAFKAVNVQRGEVSPDALRGWTLPLSHLVSAEVEDGKITLVGTNFAQAAGAGALVFAVAGTDGSHDVTFTLTELGGSNALRLLGFEKLDRPLSGSVTSEVLRESQSIGAPRLYLDTQNSGLRLEMKAGVDEGLNLKLGIGPLEVAVVDGVALISAGKDSTDPAFLAVGFKDVDGDAHANQYDLRDLFALVSDPAREFGSLITVDVGLGINLDFKFQDNVGLLDPEQHGMSYKADLITTNGPVAFSDIDFSNLGKSFKGDVVSLFKGDGIDSDNFELRMPDLSDALSNFNILALLNNPRAVLGGLDMILDRMQSLFDDYLKDIKLPVVGDAIGSAVTFFEDFRYNVIAKARVIAETPKADGTLPSTIDLLTGWFNDQLNDLFNAGNPKIQFIHAALNTDGGMRDSYLYGAINFGATIFDEMLDIAFDLGIPGFQMEVAKGSKVRLSLDYSVNLGFGLNKTGFFLLNDTDADEINIKFRADAGTFQGSAKLLGILGLKADAVTMAADGSIASGAGDDTGTAFVQATLGAALYGEQGLKIVGANAGAGEIAANLSGITVKDGLGQRLGYEKLVYVSQLNAGDLIKFTFNANVDVALGLTANVLDPTSDTDEPLLIMGKAIIPSVMAEVVFKGDFSSANDLGFVISKLGFENVRVDASALYEMLVKPIIDPIMEFVGPMADALKWLKTAPISYAVQALETAFPIFGIVNQIVGIVGDVANFATALHDTGGVFVFGDFDFTKGMSGGDEKPAKIGDVKPKLDATGKSTASTGSANPFGTFGNTQRGLSFTIPLLADPFMAINLLTGKFDQVKLVEVTATLINLNFPRASIVGKVLDAMDAPGWVEKIITGVLDVEFMFDAYAGITAGYDLGGIVNFVNTLDPVRLLDGVYLDSNKDLLRLGMGVWGKLDLLIAGLNIGGGASVNLKFNDPNDDGMLRIPEIIEIIETTDLKDLLGTLFEGAFKAEASADIWVDPGTSLLGMDPFKIELFKVDEKFPIGGNQLKPKVADAVVDNATAILNIGSNAGNSFSNITKDGDDRVVLDGPHSPIKVSLSNGQASVNGSFNDKAGGLIIPAGEGNNTIDMSALNDGFGKPTITYCGSGTDTIILPTGGLNVVFAGDGSDTITAAAGAHGTYVIFAGKGADKITIPGGNVIVFGDDDFGLRDLFVKEFATGGLTEAKVCDLLGINPDGTPKTGGRASYLATDSTTGVSERVTLSTLLERYTELTQVKAGGDADTITVGAGNHVILTGAGNDSITSTGSLGDVRVYSGDGDDVLTLGGAKLYVEAGAGSDRVVSSAGAAEIWGWGKAAGSEGLIGTEQGRTVDTFALRDGADILIGGGGKDTVYGQIGNDVIQGGLGEDVLVGGLDADLVTGGTFAITSKSGAVIDVLSYKSGVGFGQAIRLGVVDAADGADSLSGGGGADILLGGGGNDTVDGGVSNDVVIGDFGLVGLSANLIAETLETTFETSANNGTDELRGGQGNDILIAGGSNGGAEKIVDLDGSNVVLGDFGIVAGARLTEAVTFVQSRASSQGGADEIVLGSGNDLVIGGEGADTITTGLGGDIVLGDLGIIDITKSLITGNVSGASGNDVIVTGNGAGVDLTDVVIGGQGNDSVTGGSGGIVMLGDTGTIALDPTSLSAMRSYIAPGPTATSAQLAQDAATRAKVAGIAKVVTGDGAGAGGNDTLTATAGFARAVLGSGDDVATLGAFESYVLGDDGSITVLRDGSGNPNGVTLQSAGTLAGNDSITSSSAADLVIAGLGNDTIAGGTGNGVILGDEGGVTQIGSGSGRTISASSTGTSGGNDSVTGTGALTALLGLGNDRATLGDAGVIVVGDNGTANLSGASRSVTAAADANGGSDTITTGAGADTLIGGTGGDLISAGAGANRILGDTGSDDGTRLFGEITLLDGNDTVSALDGDNRVILSGGQDSATLGNGNNVVLGDHGTVTPALVLSGGPELGGSDTITTGSGNDTLIGGTGGDLISAGAGANRILGDTGSDDGTRLFGEITLLDGNDTVSALDGDNRVILSGGQDSATLGDGNNVVLGDHGTVMPTEAWSGDGNLGGSDTISTGSGSDTLIGGAGGDSIAAGAGDNRILGDSGAVTPSGQTSEARASDGNDTITSGSGNDRVILGGGADTADLGDGNNRAIGDFGVITLGALERIETTQPALGGSDSITTGSGDDVIEGGAAGDVIAGGAGDNLILGDGGVITVSPSQTTVTADDVANGGSDFISTLGGRDVVIGGIGNDTVSTGAGDDAILGDLGRFASPAGGEGVLSTTAYTTGGADSIASGNGDDMVLGGFGDDSINVGSGEDLAFGDNADVTFINTADIATLAMRGIEFGGSDTIVAEGTGDDILTGNFGADSIVGAGGDDLILGDFVRMTLSNPALALPGQSAADRLTKAEGLRPDLGLNDTITGGAGNDIIMAGFGADSVAGEDGHDMMIGDSAIILRGWAALASGAVFEKMSVDTNFAYMEGGFDTMIGGSGNDVQIGGLGPDLFFGDTAEDALFSDGYAGIFTGRYIDGFQTAVSPKRVLVTSNFAGPGAIDVVSNSQQDASIGNPFDLIPDTQLNDMVKLPDPKVVGMPSAMAQTWMGAFFAMLQQIDVLRAIAELIAQGLDDDLIASAITSQLLDAGEVSADISPVQLEVMIKAMTAKLRAEAEKSANAADFKLAAE